MTTNNILTTNNNRPGCPPDCGLRQGIAVLLLGILCATGWQSNAVAAEGASGAWTLLHAGDFDWRLRSDRLQVATGLRARVAQLARRLPEQSPQDLGRLAEREARLDTQRAQARSRLYLSADYQHRQLNRILEQIRQSLLCVEANAQLASEMACWGEAAVALLQEEQLRLALDTLRKSRRIPRKRDTPIIDRDPDLWYAHFGRGILESLITPYLASLTVSQQEQP